MLTSELLKKVNAEERGGKMFKEFIKLILENLINLNIYKIIIIIYNYKNISLLNIMHNINMQIMFN